MFSFKKKSYLELTPDYHEKREHLFFHDLINLTHGLILFLNQRQSANKNISVDEIQMLEKEIRTLQNLMKDHFKFQHKNLSHLEESDDWVSFNIAEIAVKSLIHNYLPNSSVEIFVTNEMPQADQAIIYFPIFYRIMNNLIKNMAEAKVENVSIFFKLNQSGLTIKTENKMPDDTSQIKNGLGLESIRQLSIENHGYFNFEVSNGKWLNSIYLPGPNRKSSELDQKKAA